MLIPWIKILLVALSSREIGGFIRRLGLPLITGFLVTGILAGPHGLVFFQHEDLAALHHLDKCALAFIAFAAGSELTLTTLKARLRSIVSLVGAIAISVLVSGAVAMYCLASSLPWLASYDTSTLIAVALLAGTILVAISPSSAIAVIRELRARGPFTQTVLGVTLVLDSVVIVLFAISASAASALINNVGFSAEVLMRVAAELIADLLMGVVVAIVLSGLLSQRVSHRVKQALTISIGYGLFALSHQDVAIFIGGTSISMMAEPLLVCMIAGLYIHNYSRYRSEFAKIIEDTAPVIFILFFTSAGVSTNITLMIANIGIIVALLGARFLGILVGSQVGGAFARLPLRERSVFGFGLITQAGISLGLSRESADILPAAIGENFASLFVGVIVANTLLGPGFLKLALKIMGESTSRPEPLGWGRKAVICGVDTQSIQLARQLADAGWKVTLSDDDATRIAKVPQIANVSCVALPNWNTDSVKTLKLEKCAAVVLMCDGPTNGVLHGVVAESYPTVARIARLHDPRNLKEFRTKGTLVVDPGTATISLLSYLVRSPKAASLLMGQVEDKIVADYVISNHALHGLYLRDIDLPSDLLVLAISRRGKMLLSHGYTRLKVGDQLSVVGSEESLREAELLFLS